MATFDFTSSGGNIEHTCGNVTAYVNDIVQTWFPQNYFKTVTVSTKIAYKHFDIIKNSKYRYFKNKKPFLIVQPRINVEGGEFLKGTMLTERIFPTFDSGDYGNLQKFIEDREAGYELKYMLNRLSMSFDISIVTTTATEQRKVFFHLKNRQIWNKYLAWDTVLEAHIPREMIAAIASIKGLDMNEPRELLNYLNTHTYYPISYKTKNSTGRDEYFRMYDTRLDVILENIDMDDGNKDGLVDDSYAVSFTVNLEFFADGMYNIISREPIPEFWNNGGLALELTQDEQDVVETMRLSMLLTPYRDLGIHIPPGWKTYINTAYQITSEAPEPDVTNLKSLFAPSMRKMITYHLDNNIPLDKLIKLFVLRDFNVLSPEDGDFYINFETLDLTTYRLNKLSTYRVLVIVNNAYANELMLDVIGMEEK